LNWGSGCNEIGNSRCLLKCARDVFRDGARDFALAHDDEVGTELPQVLDFLIRMGTRDDF
jgi:hypothetical protein